MTRGDRLRLCLRPMLDSFGTHIAACVHCGLLERIYGEHQRMKTTLYSLLAMLCVLPTGVVAEVNQMTCTVTVRDTQTVVKPRSAMGRAFSTFTLDLSRDPQVAWEHQNLCVRAKDFRGASFGGYLCLVVITGSGSADPSAPVQLSVEFSRDAVQLGDLPRDDGRSGARGGSMLLVPINLSGDTVSVRHRFAHRGGRGSSQRRISRVVDRFSLCTGATTGRALMRYRLFGATPH